MEMWPKIRPSGDSAVLVEFENRIDPEVNRSVRSLALAIESEALPGIKEVLPAYRALMVVYDPLEIEYRPLVKKIYFWIKKAKNIDLPPGRFFRLPTVYGALHGPDLQRVAETTHLSPEKVIQMFSETRFMVYFIGFICGLAYLGGLAEITPGPPSGNSPDPRARGFGGAGWRAGECDFNGSTFRLQLYWTNFCQSLYSPSFSPRSFFIGR